MLRLCYTILQFVYYNPQINCARERDIRNYIHTHELNSRLPFLEVNYILLNMKKENNTYCILWYIITRIHTGWKGLDTMRIISGGERDPFSYGGWVSLRWRKAPREEGRRVLSTGRHFDGFNGPISILRRSFYYTVYTDLLSRNRFCEALRGICPRD